MEMINRQLGTLTTYGGARRELLLENLFLCRGIIAAIMPAREHVF